MASTKYKHPKWQKKRLKILERDNWRCISCKAEEKTLHVHHLYYEDGTELWDYPDWAFVTLCFECHAYEGEKRTRLEQFLLNELRKRFLYDSLYILAEGLLGQLHPGYSVNGFEVHISAETTHNSLTVANAVKEFLTDKKRLDECCCAYERKANENNRD